MQNRTSARRLCLKMRYFALAKPGSQNCSASSGAETTSQSGEPAAAARVRETHLGLDEQQLTAKLPIPRLATTAYTATQPKKRKKTEEEKTEDNV